MDGFNLRPADDPVLHFYRHSEFLCPPNDRWPTAIEWQVNGSPSGNSPWLSGFIRASSESRKIRMAVTDGTIGTPPEKSSIKQLISSASSIQLPNSSLTEWILVRLASVAQLDHAAR